MNNLFIESYYVLLEIFLEKEADSQQRIFSFILFLLLFDALSKNRIFVLRVKEKDIDEIQIIIQEMQSLLRSLDTTLYQRYPELEEISSEILISFVKYQDVIHCVYYVQDLRKDNKYLDHDKGVFACLPIIFYEGQKNFFFNKYFYHLVRLKEILEQRLEQNIFDSSICKIDWNQLFFKKNKFDKSQILAILSSLANQFTLISGAPGTGKTTIVAAILYLYGLYQKKADIVLTSLTGKATDKLFRTIRQCVSSFQNEFSQELLPEINIRSTTIHHLLEYSISQEKFRYGSKCLLAIDLIFIDESSMLDIVLLNQLFLALLPSTKIVMLGDANQLTPVQPGAILSDIQHFLEKYQRISVGKQETVKIIDESLLLKSSEHLIILKKVYRSTSFIQKYASLILETGSLDIEGLDFDDNYITLLKEQSSEKTIEDWCKQVFLQKYDDNMYQESYTFVDLLLKVSNCDISLLSNKESREYFVVCCLLSYFSEHFLRPTAEQNTLLDRIESSCVLTFTKEGMRGSYYHNQLVSRFLAEQMGEEYNLYTKWNHGVPILLLENLYDYGLYNGDVGIVIKGIDKQLYGIFIKGDALVTYPMSSLRNVEPAFTTTIHKSQGSEYDRVLLITPTLENQDVSLQQHQYISLLYTGITRAKKHVFIDTTSSFFSKSYQIFRKEKTLLEL